MSKINDIVWALAEPVVKSHGCELWDIEYVKEAGNWFLRVFIDREDGISIEHCEAVSRELDPILDEKDLIPGSYTFEVSSAGAERALKRPSDYEKFLGHLIEVKLYKSREGHKEYIGILNGYYDGDVEIDVSGNMIKFEKSEVANVRLRIR